MSSFMPHRLPNDLHPRTLIEARKALDSGQLSPRDLLEQCLDRIDLTEPRLKAWNLVDGVGARASAGGSSPDDGPLWGIPIAVKDIFDVRGLPTTASSRVLRDNVASGDSAVVRTLREAGAIILGKTNTHEFAFGYVSPPTSNPWDLSRIPGGSSGGSAAALAAGHCFGALGSDTGGSIRVPACLCGVSGLKPEHGRLSLDGVIPLAPSLDTAGPLAHSALDLMLMWSVLSGEQPDLEPPPVSVAVPNAEAIPEIDQDAADAFEEAVSVFRTFSTVSEVSVPEFSAFDGPRSAIILSEALRVHSERGWWPQRKSDYTEETALLLETAEAIAKGAGFAEGRRMAVELAERLKSAVSASGILITPAAPGEAPTHEEAAVTGGQGPRRPVALRLARLVSPINIAGLPALSVPCGFSNRGLPLGIQIIGMSSRLVLAAGAEYQRRTDWHTRVPPL